MADIGDAAGDAEDDHVAGRGQLHVVEDRRAVLDDMAEALLTRGSLEREEFLALLGEAA